MPIELYRILQRLDERLVLSSLPGLSSNVRLALGFLEESFREGVTVADAASHARVHRASLSRKIYRELHGHDIYISVSEYLGVLRLRRARELFETEPLLECKEVAHMVGVGTRELEKLFKRYTRMTPTEYKKAIAAP